MWIGFVSHFLGVGVWRLAVGLKRAKIGFVSYIWLVGIDLGRLGYPAGGTGGLNRWMHACCVRCFFLGTVCYSPCFWCCFVLNTAMHYTILFDICQMLNKIHHEDTKDTKKKGGLAAKRHKRHKRNNECRTESRRAGIECRRVGFGENSESRSQESECRRHARSATLRAGSAACVLFDGGGFCLTFGGCGGECLFRRIQKAGCEEEGDASYLDARGESGCSWKAYKQKLGNKRREYARSSNIKPCKKP